jgi:hypothetical protein
MGEDSDEESFESLRSSSNPDHRLAALFDRRIEDIFVHQPT